jgi:dsRNA-gated channel SID-1
VVSQFYQGFAIFFFEIAVTNKFLTYQESMELNKPCVLFDYFDYHGINIITPSYCYLSFTNVDIWHFLSALGLMCVMTLVYVLDTDLALVPRARIHVF